jgi:hypothetical protein
VFFLFFYLLTRVLLVRRRRFNFHLDTRHQLLLKGTSAIVQVSSCSCVFLFFIINQGLLWRRPFNVEIHPGPQHAILFGNCFFLFFLFGRMSSSWTETGLLPFRIFFSLFLGRQKSEVFPVLLFFVLPPSFCQGILRFGLTSPTWTLGT